MSRPCPDKQDRIADLVSGVAPEAEARALEEHLGGCPGCQAYLEALRREDEQLAAYFGAIDGAAARGRDNVAAAIRRAASTKQTRTLSIGRAMMKSRTVRWTAAAAAVAIVILGAASFLPFSSEQNAGNGGWWLGPSTVWAQEIRTALTRVKGVIYRDQTVSVTDDGQWHTSSTWSISYMGKDSIRHDIYDNDRLREIQWYTPDGDGFLQTSVRFDLSSHHVCRHDKRGDWFRVEDPVERMKGLLKWADSSDRMPGTRTIDGRECVGFEIYPDDQERGNDPNGWFSRIWADPQAKLPVRVEIKLAGRGRRATIFVWDRFNWNPDLPADTFEPNIPAGFVFGHPDELRDKK